MKNLSFLFILMTFFVNFSFAQGPSKEGRPTPPSAEERAQKTITQLNEKTKLSEKKQAELKKVLVASFEEMDAARSKESTDRSKETASKEGKGNQDEQMKALDAKVKAILSEEEYVQYQALQKEKKGGPNGEKPAKKGTN
jgi:hypothetical protein